MNALIINCSPVRSGATAEIVRIIGDKLSTYAHTKTICIADYAFSFCTGCRSCHSTAECIQNDDIPQIIKEFETADIIAAVSPSYWADVPAQFKAFIDRCTPWCNTHEPHAALSPGKSGYSVALRTGPGMKECERIIQTIEHFYGHMEIECCGSLGLTGIECRADVEHNIPDILRLCTNIINNIHEKEHTHDT